jgi:hypothetical protein
MAQLDLNEMFPFGVGQRQVSLEQNLPLFEELIRVMELSGQGNTSKSRVLKIEMGRVRTGDMRLREVEGFEYLINDLLHVYGAELGLGGIAHA